MADLRSPFARGQQAMASSLSVAIASDQSAVSVDTELPAAAAISADNTVAPTAPSVYTFGLVFDGTDWDRMRGTSADGVLVNLGANNDVTISGTVDTELPAAAALADAEANPTVPGVGAFLNGFNGTTWDRVRTANTGRLQVDVITGGGSDTPTNPVNTHVTSASLAAGASVDLDTAEAASKKLARAWVWSSVPYRVRFYTVDNAVESTNPVGVGGGAAFQSFEFKPPHRDYITLGATAGLDAFRAEVTNLHGTDAADVYAQFMYED